MIQNSQKSQINKTTKKELPALKKLSGIIIGLLCTSPDIIKEENLKYFTGFDSSVDSSTKKVFLKLFHSPANEALIKKFVNRLTSPKAYLGSPVHELALFLYSQVVIRMALANSENDFKLVLFASCFNLAQKYLLDHDTQPDSMAKLLGMQKKQLYKREFFLLSIVYGFALTVDSGAFQAFSLRLNKF